MSTFRSSRLEVFCEKGVLRIFAKFTRKHLCQSLFFNKVEGVRSATLLKKRLWHRCFSVNFAKFLGIPFYRTPRTTASFLFYEDFSYICCSKYFVVIKFSSEIWVYWTKVYVKIFLLVCSVSIIQQVYHVMNKYV